LKGRRKVKKYHHQIRHIFRKAGHIRELQLEMAWLRRHRKFDLIRIMEYDANLKKADKSFHIEVPEMLNMFKKARKKLGKYLQLVTQDESDHYVTEHWCVTLQAVLAVADESAWHETRKKIKQLLYARNWIPSNTVQTAPVKKIFQSLDKLQDLIGRWHDLLVLENKIMGIEKKVKGHAMLIRGHQLAIGRLNLEKENLAERIRRAFLKICTQIKAYH
jgi:CHAD domain-containing protein